MVTDAVTSSQINYGCYICSSNIYFIYLFFLNKPVLDPLYPCIMVCVSCMPFKKRKKKEIRCKCLSFKYYYL